MKKMLILVLFVSMAFTSNCYALDSNSNNSEVVDVCFVENVNTQFGSSDVKVTINNSPVETSGVKPYISLGGCTMVPLRAFAENFGAKVEWDNVNKAILIDYDNQQIKVNVNCNSFSCKSTNTPNAIIIGGTTFVPLRYSAELFGASVTWDAITKIANVTITSDTLESIVIIDEDSNGKTIEVSKGKKIKLKLSSNPTTGFGWSYVAHPDKQILEEQSNDYEPINSNNGLCGAGGTDIWVYNAKSEGQTDISLKYCRSWENVPPIITFNVVIQVK